MLNVNYQIHHNFEEIKGADREVTLHVRGGPRFTGRLNSWSQEQVVLDLSEGGQALVRYADLAAFNI